MDIFHFAAPFTDIGPLCQAQSALGHQVSVFSKTPESLPDFKKGQIVHFHNLEGVAIFSGSPQPGVEKLLALKQQAVEIYYTSYCSDPLANKNSRNALGINDSFFNSCFSHLFLSSPRSKELRFLHNSSSWLPLALNFSNCDYSRFDSSMIGLTLRVLHIPWGIPIRDTEAIVESANLLKAKGLRCNLEIINPEELQSPTAIEAALSSAHLVIEHLSLNAPGQLCCKAQSFGTPVVTNINPESKADWEQLKMNPALDADVQTITKRLESVLREPRCLKDLSKRSRSYSEAYHQATRVAEETVKYYCKFG